MEVDEESAADEDLMPPPAYQIVPKAPRATSNNTESNVPGPSRDRRVARTPSISRSNSTIPDEEESVGDEEHDDYEFIRLTLIGLLRGIFDSDDALEDSCRMSYHHTQQFYHYYTGLRKQYKRPSSATDDDDPMKTIVIDELCFRLNFLMEDVSRSNDRLRCFNVLVITALILHYYKNDSLMLNFLVKYAMSVSDADCANARINAIKMLAKIFKYWYVEPIVTSEKRKKKISKDVLAKKEMPIPLRNKMYGLFRKRHLDKLIPVRIAVITAVSDFQDMTVPSDFKEAVEESPKDILIRSFQDKSVVVQLAAVKYFHLDTAVEIPDAHIDRLAHVAGGGYNDQVRLEAMRKLGLVPFTQINKEIVKELLDTTLGDLNPTIRNFAKRHILAPWLAVCARMIAEENGYSSESEGKASKSSDKPLPGLGGALFYILEMLTTKDGEIKLEDEIVYNAYDSLRSVMFPHRMADLKEMVRYIELDQRQPKLLSRYYLDPIIDENTGFQKMALYAFIWRTMIEYCRIHSDPKRDPSIVNHEAVKEDCFERLTPALEKIVDVLEVVWKMKDISVFTDEPHPSITEQEAIGYNRTLTEIMKVGHIMLIDEHAQRKWKALIGEMILNRNMHKNVTDQFAETIVHLFDTEPGRVEPTSFMENFLKEIGAYKAVEDQNRRIQAYKIKTGKDLNKRLPSFALDPKDNKTLAYAMQVVHSLIDTGVFLARPHQYLSQLAGFMAGEVFLYVEPYEARILTFKNISAIMMSNPDAAMKYHWILLEITKTDPHTDVAVACYHCYYDLIQHYRPENVEKWPKADMPYWWETVEYMILNWDGTVQDDVPNVLRMAACKIACKMLLLNPIAEKDEDTEIAHSFKIYLYCLVKLYFDIAAQEMVEYRAMFSKFFWLYVRQSDLNRKRALQAVNFQLLRVWRRITADTPTRDMPDLQVMCNAVMMWLDRDLIPYKAEENGAAQVPSRENSIPEVMKGLLRFGEEVAKMPVQYNKEHFNKRTEDCIELVLRYAADVDLSELELDELILVNESYDTLMDQLVRHDHLLNATSQNHLAKIQRQLEILIKVCKDRQRIKEEQGDEDYIHITKIIDRRPRGGRRGRGAARGQTARAVCFEPNAEPDPAWRPPATEARRRNQPRTARRAAAYTDEPEGFDME